MKSLVVFVGILLGFVIIESGLFMALGIPAGELWKEAVPLLACMLVQAIVTLGVWKMLMRASDSPRRRRRR